MSPKSLVIDPARPNCWSSAIRSLSSTELDHFEAHLTRLDGSCLQSRFGNVVNENFVRTYANRVDCANTSVFGCFVDGTLRGAAELRSLQSAWCATAEAAFTVEKTWRRRGIATALMRHLIGDAAQRGVEHVVLSCHAFNLPMRRLVERFGAKTVIEDLDSVAKIGVAELADTA